MIIHMTTVHLRDDSRVRFKEVASLAAKVDAVVALYVQDGQGDEIDAAGGYRVVDTGPRMARLKRMTVGAWRMIRAVRKARPRIVFFHDPELLPWALLLQFTGIRVVYDVHEDYPQQVKHNRRIPPLARKVVPPIVAAVEWVCSRCFSAVVGATEEIAARFPPRKTWLLRNFPILSELEAPADRPYNQRPLEFTYIGTISQNRNIFRMIDAAFEVAQTHEARFRLAGDFSVKEDDREARALPGWQFTQFEGWVGREEVSQILADSRAGLVVLKPVPHEMVTLPIKLFEYMAAGIPVISSDFPRWRAIVETADCGLLVDPENAGSIAGAIRRIFDDPAEAQAMGERGRRAVMEIYNWEAESETLLQLVDDLGIKPRHPSLAM